MKIREAIELELRTSFPECNISSIDGNYSIRFELGGDLENGTLIRIDRVVERANEIYVQTIGEDDVLLIVKEHPDEDLWDRGGDNKNHLYSSVDASRLRRFPGPFEQVYYEVDRYGSKQEYVFERPLLCDVLIGRFSKREIDAREIIKGIANREMGFEPCIPQDVTLFSPRTTNGFRMYDDRGCDIWSKDKALLQSIYIKLNEWILDYNREEADAQFK